MRKTTFTLKKLSFGVGALSLFLACIFALQTTGAYAVYYGDTVRSLPIYCVEREDKKIAISFDCAWGDEHTDELLSALRLSGAKATFFMVEFWANKYPERVKKILSEGHEIGTHSSTHSYMSKMNEADVRGELTSSCQAIEKITGKKVELFRPPYGDYDDLVVDTAKAMGLYTIQWSVDSLDWKDLSATDVAMRIINQTQSGSIILCHNNGLHTAEALPIVLETLIHRGYTFVTIGELIYRENNKIDPTGKQLKETAPVE